MLEYALERDCRTGLRLFCRTRYEISSEENARFGSDCNEPLVNDGINPREINGLTPEKLVHETSNGGGSEPSIFADRRARGLNTTAVGVIGS